MKKSLFFPFVTAVAFTSLISQKAAAQNNSPFWSLAGNSNATTSSKLGNTTAIPLRLITNNSTRIYISPNAGNVGLGTTSPAHRLDVAGNINIGKGFGLYMENRRVLRVDSVNGNVFLGTAAGARNTGVSNTATGGYALAAANSGGNNSAYGYSALNYNTTGYSNTATGSFALSINTTGFQNVANGHFALYVNSTGSSNTATGYAALFNNTTGTQNVAFGQGALALNSSGSFNTAVGSEAMNESSIGTENIAVGYRALLKNSTGSRNVAMGSNALAFNYGAWGNTAVGDYAGGRFNHGYYNTFIGSDADATFGGSYNSVALGSSAKVTAPNQVRIGNSYTTSIGGFTTWTNISDGRVKRNIQENVPGLAFINKLKPVTYNLDLDAADKILAVPAAKDKDGKMIAKQPTQMEIAARTAKQQVVYTGFVAQDVEKAAKELNYNFSGVDAAKNEKDLYGLRYTEFIMPLVKAVQELSKENEALKSRLEKLEATMNGKQPVSTSFQAAKAAEISTATLGQNAPNPAAGSTRISYSLPKGTSHAQLQLMDGSGRTVRTVSLTASGMVDVNTTGLSGGVYSYSMIVDGKTVATKKLTVAR